MKDLLATDDRTDLIAWREGDEGDHDVRDLIAILEALNVIDFPNDQPTHPIQSYEKWSIPLRKFAADYEENGREAERTRYYRLRAVLLGALVLYDTIRRDFRTIRNESGGKGGKFNIVEGGPGRTHTFPFAKLPSAEYRLTKGAAMPILAAFRNCVELDEAGNARWVGGFEADPGGVESLIPGTRFGNR